MSVQSSTTSTFISKKYVLILATQKKTQTLLLAEEMHRNAAYLFLKYVSGTNQDRETKTERRDRENKFKAHSEQVNSDPVNTG